MMLPTNMPTTSRLLCWPLKPSLSSCWSRGNISRLCLASTYLAVMLLLMFAAAAAWTAASTVHVGDVWQRGDRVDLSLQVGITYIIS